MRSALSFPHLHWENRYHWLRWNCAQFYTDWITYQFQIALGQGETWDTSKITWFFIKVLKMYTHFSVLHIENLAVLPTKIIFGRNSFVQILHNILYVSFPKWNYISYMCFHYCICNFFFLLAFFQQLFQICLPIYFRSSLFKI